MRSAWPAAALAAALACRSAPAPVAARPEAPAAPPAAAAAQPAAPPWAPSPPPGPLPRQPQPQPVVREALLSGGLRAVVVEHRRRPVVAIRLVLPRGAVADADREAGATWLAAALATDFHERDEAGQEIIEEKSLRRQVVEAGGSAGFAVGADVAVLGVSGYAADTARYLRLLADAVARPRHGVQSFSARRNALLDAIEDLEGWEPEALREAVAQASFGPGHPYARPVHGTAASLQALGLEDVTRVQARLLAPRGATLLVVGDVSAQAVLAEARTAFGRWRDPPVPGPAAPALAPPAVPRRSQEVGYLRRQPASTLTVCASRPLADLRGSDAALEVLARLLGTGTQGRLTRALREEQGLSYGAEAEVVRRRQARSLLTCAPVAAAQGERGLRTMRQVLAAVQAGQVTDAEVARARALRLGELDAAFDDGPRITASWIEALALGLPAPRPDLERVEVERVTADEVRRVARTALAPETLRWIVSGDRAAAARAVEANRLGRLAPMALGR